MNASAPPDYMPPMFVAFDSTAMETFSIYPQCGSARIGLIGDSSMSTMYSCVLSVEGPVQFPPLGSAVSPLSVSLDVDEDQTKRVVVASFKEDPSKASLHQLQISEATEESAVQKAEKSEKCECAMESNGEPMKRMAKGYIHEICSVVGCKKRRGRYMAKYLKSLGVIDENMDERPAMYCMAADAPTQTIERLFSSDIRVAIAVLPKVRA
ncbi:hypothetical protein EC988_000561 [Linderina pennispora]|nr:hypothetical protein EC988_000561 [Linderina pennispora]